MQKWFPIHPDQGDLWKCNFGYLGGGEYMYIMDDQFVNKCFCKFFWMTEMV